MEVTNNNNICSIVVLNENQQCLPDNILDKLTIKHDCDEGIDKELCILESSNNIDTDTKEKLKLKYFKPYTESYDENHWLNNNNIDEIQHQLNLKFPEYEFSYIHMIDLVMIPPSTKKYMNNDIKDIKSTNIINKIKNNHCKYFGIVFNTDTSKGRGQHWFAIFMNFSVTPYLIEYFNSSGQDIRNKNFNNYFEQLALDISKELKKECTYLNVSNIEHQSPETGNCGIYSLYYIYSRLNGIDHKHFAENLIKDDTMTEFRKIFYRNTFE